MRVLKSGNKFAGVIEVLKKNAVLKLKLCWHWLAVIQESREWTNRGSGEIECHLYNNDGTNLNKQVIENSKITKIIKPCFLRKTVKTRIEIFLI